MSRSTSAVHLPFDRDNQVKAAIYTAVIAFVLLLMIWFLKFYQPVVPPAPAEEFIEINLGSSDVGSGNDQPELPGDPAPEQQTAYTPAQQTSSAPDESVKDIEEINEPEAPPVYKPATSKPEAKEINKETRVVKTEIKPAAVSEPAPARPRAVMGQVRGGNGAGGNGAATYRPGTGEGQGGGPGDQGSIGGNPNGRNYTPRQLGVRTVSIPARSFEDDFKESGKIVLDISVNENGRLESANFQPRGSSISNRAQIEIAKRRAREITYPKYDGGFKQSVVFEFQVRN